MDDQIARIDASLARTARLSNHLDSMFSAGLKFAEHQYLLEKKIAMMEGNVISGIDRATLSALQQMPSNTFTVPQLDNWTRQFLDMSQQVRSIFSGLDQFIGTMGDHLASMAAMASARGGLLDAIRSSSPMPSNLNAMMGSLPKIQDFNRFWDTIAPAIEGLREIMAEAEEGDTVLEEAQFGFADHLWNVFYLRGFAHVPQTVRDAVVTNMLAAQTRSDEFADDLRQQVEASRMMRKRWGIIEAALEAHANRRYELSVPVVLSQIEGTVGDVMFLKDLVAKEGNKYYLVDEDGNFKLNKKGKRLSPVTLDPALKNARLEEQANLSAAAEFMSEVLVQRRNDVMHGRDLAYGRAKFSVQALLVLTVLAQGIAELESGPR